MRQPHIEDSIRLTRDIPELSLHCGEVGVVKATWFAPATAYEVEFHPPELTYERRALLLAECFVIEEPEPKSDVGVDVGVMFEPQHLLG